MAEDDAALAARVQGGGLQVTHAEWLAIEDVPPAVRRVGALFQSAARGPPAPAAPVPFDEELWAAMHAEAAAAPAGGTKLQQLRRKRLAESVRADRTRLAEDLREDRPPRLERYGQRFECFLAAALAWLERRRRSPLLAAVTAGRLRAAAERRGPLPPAVAARLAALEAGRGAAPAAALQELGEHEELLAGAPLLDAELALHDDQRAFAAAVCAACAPGAAPLLLRYQTPPSGGKTSATALLGACLQLQTQRHVIYACYSRQVRIDVCKHLLAAAVPFAIVVQGVASPHNSCYHQRPRADVPPAEPEKRVEWSLSACRRCDRFPVALICDLASSVLLLRHGEQHVLLFDEPTADVAPGMQADVRRLLRCAPAVTVLMSAGVPPFEAMPAFVAHFCARHAGAELRTVASARLPMSVTALDAAERVWAPHQLGVPVDVIEADGHLLRFYSPRVLAQLAPAGGVAFADLLSYAAVRAACLRLLRAAPPAAAPPAPAEPLELQHFCTRHAWRLPGASLVILDAVADFLRTALTPNVADLPTLRRLLKHEERHLKAEARQGGRADLPRSKSEGPPPAPAAEAPPELWPAACVLNTLEHLQRHAPQAAKSFPTKWLRAALPLPTAVRDTSHETVVEAALCGVLPFGGLGDALFEATAQTLAEQARESLAVADAQLIYGLNFPVERVVVGCQPLSYLEMKQLCGRAGRTGRLAKAEVVFLAEATLRAAMVPPADAAQLAEAAVNFAL